MNSNLEAFIRAAQAIAAERGVRWRVELGTDGGVAKKGDGWNLTQMTKASPPPTYWLNDFGTDRTTVEFLNGSPQPGPDRTYFKEPLSKNWQDLIKACAIDQLFVRRNTCHHVVDNVVRPLRVLATCSARNDPSAITVEDVNSTVQVARKIQASGKLADLIFGVIRSILDSNNLIDDGPLFHSLKRDKRVHVRTAQYSKAEKDIRSDLEERKSAEKLPERRAFWELVRIVFTERPKSVLDLLRFALARTLILTGLRDGECTLLPADWKRFREYLDTNGLPAGRAGGVSRSLMLRHFAEKQRVLYEDSIALFETVQHVPAALEEAVSTALDQVVTVTEPLRKTLRRQIETGRILPRFEKTELVRVAELYTYLTGNPFVVRYPEEVRRKYVDLYQREFNPSVFDELRSLQLEGIRTGRHLTTPVYNYFRRLNGVPFRKANGAAWDGNREGRTVWSEVYFRIDEIEEYFATHVTTKQSDLTPLKLADGELSAWELMFLMPKRALGDSKDDGLCDITRYCSVGRMDPQMMIRSLGGLVRQTLFGAYGQTEEDRGLTLRPHSLRHLQNTELFRLGIADTIITKRFNRRKVAQSYDYDHRSLVEELEHVELKPEVEARLGEKSATIARLIKSGKARGPIVDAFKRIQLTSGEDAAIEYLSAEADGFHSTPYGHCINSFLVDPCPKHLECFTGCKHLSATDLAQNRHNLVQLESRFALAVKLIEERKAQSLGTSNPELLEAETASADGLSGALEAGTKSIQSRISRKPGLDNQLAHAKVRLEGVRKLLATAPGQLVFPDGTDLSHDPAKRKGRVLDGHY